jgi:GTP diphosphokinase / guanosine-3',5'-bis(diphosphate) 3'-diphosphatase
VTARLRYSDRSLLAPRTLRYVRPVLTDLIPGWDLSAEAAGRLDMDLLARAYRFSEKAHAGQTRRNGDPYVTHCVEVAKILAELQLDSITVASGLIHDVVEDTAYSVEDVEREFGREVARSWTA